MAEWEGNSLMLTFSLSLKVFLNVDIIFFSKKYWVFSASMH